jgi:type II secretory pathway pseudopilin PulG
MSGEQQSRASDSTMHRTSGFSLLEMMAVIEEQ